MLLIFQRMLAQTRKTIVSVMGKAARWNVVFHNIFFKSLFFERQYYIKLFNLASFSCNNFITA